MSSIINNRNASSSCPIKNCDLFFFFFLFYPNIGLKSVELSVEAEILVHSQAPHNAWKNQHYQSVEFDHGSNDLNVKSSNITDEAQHNVMGYLGNQYYKPLGSSHHGGNINNIGPFGLKN